MAKAEGYYYADGLDGALSIAENDPYPGVAFIDFRPSVSWYDELPGGVLRVPMELLDQIVEQKIAQREKAKAEQMVAKDHVAPKVKSAVRIP
jgi:hypothetical protein